MALSLPAWRSGSLLALALLLVPGCDGNNPTAPEGAARPLPAFFWLKGSADSTFSDGSTVSCLLELGFELTEGPRETH